MAWNMIWVPKVRSLRKIKFVEEEDNSEFGSDEEPDDSDLSSSASWSDEEIEITDKGKQSETLYTGHRIDRHVS